MASAQPFWRRASQHPWESATRWGWAEIDMSLRYDTTILDHLAEYFFYLSDAPSFWFSNNSSYDHEFHLSHRFGMTSYDYECIVVAAKLAEFNKTRGFFISLSRLEAFLAGHWFATSNSIVQFDVDTKKIDLNASMNWFNEGWFKCMY